MEKRGNHYLPPREKGQSGYGIPQQAWMQLFSRFPAGRKTPAQMRKKTAPPAPRLRVI
jgi:hypothetical protein